MTSIEQLQVCGIRSFDPNPSNRQTVTFQKPLTVILGKNGAGKTTIIEALLNACTGSMPPGSGVDKSSFVYDPKTMGESEVKAQIRLVFTGKGGQVMQVIRSFQATRNRKRVAFTTLDNTVAYQDKSTGKIISSTYRASDVDRVVPEMLGVSPAVLEHVVFCHQENANWPLAPPKDLKLIFDDIFAATRYVLALDRLRENSKELRKQQKEHEVNLMALREHREQANQLEKEIQLKDEQVRAFQTRSKDIEPELRELEAAAAALDNVAQNVTSLNREAAVIEGAMEEKRRVVEKRRTGLPASSHTVEQLEEMRRNLTTEALRAEKDREKKTDQLRTAQETKREKTEALYVCRARVHSLEVELQQHKARSAELRSTLSGISDEFVISEDSVDERSVSRVLAKAQECVKENRAALQTSLDVAEEAVRAVEAKRHGLLRDLDAEAKEVEMLTTLRTATERRVAETTAALSALGGSAGCETRLSQLKAELATIDTRLSANKALQQQADLGQKRRQLLDQINAENTTLSRLRQEMAKRKHYAGGESELAGLRTQVQEHAESLQRELDASIVPTFTTLSVPVTRGHSASELAADLTRARQQREGELIAAQQLLETLECAVAASEQRRTMLAEDCAESESQIKHLQRECEAALGDEKELPTVLQLEKRLHDARQRVLSLTQKKQSLEALATCYDEFMEVAKASNRCAVCGRDFHSQDAAHKFVEANEAKRRASPEEMAALQAELSSAAAHVESLQALLKPLESLHTLLAKLPAVAQIRANLETQLEAQKVQRTQAIIHRDDCRVMAQRLGDVANALSGLVLLENRVQEERRRLVQREAQLQRVKEELERDDGESSSGTYEELSRAHDEAQERHHQLSVQLQETQRAEDASGVLAEAARLEAQRQEVQKSLYQAELAVAKASDMQSAWTNLVHELDDHKARLGVIEKTRSGKVREVSELETQLREAREAQRTSRDAAQQKLDLAVQQLDVLQRLVPPVIDFIRSNAIAQLQEQREQCRRLEADCKAHEATIVTLTSEIEAAKSVIDSQRQREYDLARHIEVLRLEAELRTDEARLSDVKKSLASLKGAPIQNVKRLLGEGAAQEPLHHLHERIRAEITKLGKIQAQQEGSVETMMQDINERKRQLASEKYQNIEKRYRSTFLKVQTTEIAVKDIEKYHGALEKAVQSYHQEKIAQINQIIAELWRQTYRGSDIDTVEIHSESETTATTTARRSYSYRVVMRRGNSELDMRGRCSAGQKVLASVIIRLALSEAFCCDCGILALDEPTTNLDEDNARSLAESLRGLIEARRSIKHFQLIVITHDEQFVRALGGHTLEKFYYVHKDREGAFSVIDERTFDQLFA